MPGVGTIAVCFLGLALVTADGPRIQWPDDVAELDAVLCRHSPRYRAMAEAVRKRQPYRVANTTDYPLGTVRTEDGGLVIELNPNIPRNRRATILVWEMANAYQRETFDEIGRRARSGEIASAREYGIRMELVEYGSHRLHRDVLEDLSRAGIRITGDFLFFINPKLKSLEEYRVPTAHDYIDAQAKGGHTKHYESWYDKIVGNTPK